MRTWLVASLLAIATPALADEAKPKPSPDKQAEGAPKPLCKKTIVGKGLDRKVVCVFEKEIVVPGKAPRPSVVIAPVDGRRVTGRPKQTDPLNGLHRSRHD